jgi:hypothetical protein
MLFSLSQIFLPLKHCLPKSKALTLSTFQQQFVARAKQISVTSHSLPAQGVNISILKKLFTKPRQSVVKKECFLF